MFNLSSFIRNNKNGKSYAVARSNLKFKYRPSASTDTNNPVNEPTDKDIAERIKFLQTNLRFNNLRVYKQNIKEVKKRRFAVYTLPAVLLLTTALSFALPDQIVYSEDFNTYKKVETVFSDGKMQTIDDGVTYCFTEFDRTFEDSKKDTIVSTSPYMNLYILENGEGIYVPYTFENNELVLNSRYINEGAFVVDDIDASNGEELSDLYSDMFDRALDMLIESRKVGKEYTELLNNLDRETKVNFVARLVEYEYSGEKDINVLFPTKIIKIGSTIITALYLFLYGIPALRKSVIDCYGLEVDGPRLKNENESNLHRFSELPLEYRSAFIAAETNRIEELARIADEYLTVDSKEMLLTNFEKKLILK